ncbi:MAG: 16S rRNA (cytosine(1402)-N(4))-methyltransferase RsmH [Elusimicrobia bacterium]|nr:16S rRNA (cytosine(1402)-N(4))-methyltransferase RsmH [Elusimicrobiota bacterium]
MEFLHEIEGRAGLSVGLEDPADLSAQPRHVPVLLGEVLRHLVTDSDGLYLDATLGLGGHAEGILTKLSAQGRLLGLDMDPEAIQEANLRLSVFVGRLRIIRANFRTLGQILDAEKFFPLSAALFDLGVSSLHFDKAERGFSFQLEGPLDMRMSPESPLTAEAIVNRWPVEQLAMLIKEFGEEPQALRIARAIARRRAERPFETTTELASVIEKAAPRLALRPLGQGPRGVHPATRTFMALRIAVNAELENLTRGLETVLPYVKAGGRVGVISFHSLEDRIVKNVFSSFVSLGWCRWISVEGRIARGSPFTPSRSEVVDNPRARSAKLRIVEKTPRPGASAGTGQCLPVNDGNGTGP